MARKINNCLGWGTAHAAQRALDGLRLLREHALDRCQGLGVIDVQATTMVPGLEASPAPCRLRLAAGSPLGFTS
jgi:hypothetical protein